MNGDVITVQHDGLRKRSFVIRYLTLFGGEAGSKVCVLLAFAYLARMLGPRDFGAIELALSMTIFFVLAAETGLGSYGARIVETAPHRAPELVARAGLVRAMLAIPAYAIVLALSVQRGTPVLALYGLTILLTPFNTQWVFQGLRQMQWVAAGSLARYGTFALLVLFLVRPGSDTRIVAAAEVSGALALALFNTVLLSRVLKIRLDWRGAWRGAADLFRQAWFLGASDLTWAAMWYSPTIVIGWMDPGRTELVAWLAASVRIVMALHAFVWLYFFNLVPNLSRELHEGLDSWRDLIHRSLAVSMWPACFIAAAGTLLAPLGMVTLFGQPYAQAVLPFQIVIWMIPIAWLSGHFRFSLIVSGHQHLEFAASAVAGLVTAIAAVFGARAYGAPGAASALLAGGVVNAIVSGILMRRVIGSVRVGAALPAFLTCLGSILIGLTASWVAGRIAGAALACAAYLLVTASQRDVSRLRRAWEGRS
jgi:O-antigen/teichoic acid export membrane protein